MQNVIGDDACLHITPIYLFWQAIFQANNNDLIITPECCFRILITLK